MKRAEFASVIADANSAHWRNMTRKWYAAVGMLVMVGGVAHGQSDPQRPEAMSPVVLRWVSSSEWRGLPRGRSTERALSVRPGLGYGGPNVAEDSIGRQRHPVILGAVVGVLIGAPIGFAAGGSLGTGCLTDGCDAAGKHRSLQLGGMVVGSILGGALGALTAQTITMVRRSR